MTFSDRADDPASPSNIDSFSFNFHSNKEASSSTKRVLLQEIHYRSLASYEALTSLEMKKGSIICWLLLLVPVCASTTAVEGYSPGPHGDSSFFRAAAGPRRSKQHRPPLASRRALVAEDICTIILEEETFGEKYCDCQQQQNAAGNYYYSSTCQDVCQVCLDGDVCLGFSSYHAEFVDDDRIGLSPTRVRLEYTSSGSGSSQSTFAFEESLEGCAVEINGQRCRSCEYNFGCIDGVAIMDCTNLDGIDRVFDDCDTTGSVPTSSPFFAYRAMNLEFCFANNPGTSSPTGSPVDIPPKKFPLSDDSKDDNVKLYTNDFNLGRGGLDRKVRRRRGL